MRDYGNKHTLLADVIFNESGAARSHLEVAQLAMRKSEEFSWVAAEQDGDQRYENIRMMQQELADKFRQVASQYALLALAEQGVTA